jgi:apolipoprotein D and lipocalin family protein
MNQFFKLLQALFVSVMALQIFISTSASAADLQTVPYVDVAQYAGTWYQIARNPLFFEGNCFCARQVLAPLSEGVVSVYNSCNQNSLNGTLQEIRGTATDENPGVNSQFLVDFNLPHKGQYWIIGLASDYRYAVVSDPSQKSLYILSKTPTLSEDDYKTAVGLAAQQMDVSKLVVTQQVGCQYP